MHRNREFDRQYIEYLEARLREQSPDAAARAQRWNSGNRALMD
jgi:hypothetical protein